MNMNKYKTNNNYIINDYTWIKVVITLPNSERLVPPLYALADACKLKQQLICN